MGSNSEPPRPDRSVRRAIVALVVGAIVAFVAVGAGSTYFATQIARGEELAEAVRSSHVLVNIVIAKPLRTALTSGGQNIAALDDAVRVLREHDLLVRLEILDQDRKIVYSDDHALIGRQALPLSEAPSGQASAAVVSAADFRIETGSVATGDLVKVDVPLQMGTGSTGIVQLFFTDERLRTSEAALTQKLVLSAVGTVTLLLLVQMPVSVSLLRRVGRAKHERARLLANEVAAADRERRNIARDLHDGVVQDLAGAGYALDALASAIPVGTEGSAQQLLDIGRDSVHRSIQSLRTLIVQIGPPDLTSTSLPLAIAELASRIKGEDGLDVGVDVDVHVTLNQQVAAIVYRTVRECLSNVVEHAAAQHALVEIRSDADTVFVQVTDDGQGFTSDLAERHRNGHVGLKLLTDTIADLGGQLTIGPGGERGVIVRGAIPIGHRASESHD